jgi:ATP adenylyltransferase
MDRIFTPWRYAYIKSASDAQGCLFCDVAGQKDDARNLIVHRGEHCFVILNAYPYTNGHVMIVPLQHTAELRKLDMPAAAEMMELSQRMESLLRKLYQPEGINLGMNIGKAAGAGIADHIHMHILPRWTADANFMSVVGETRVLPEALEMTWKRMKEAWE